MTRKRALQRLFSVHVKQLLAVSFVPSFLICQLSSTKKATANDVSVTPATGVATGVKGEGCVPPCLIRQT